MRAAVICLVTAAALPAADLDVLLPPETDQITYLNVKQLAASQVVKNHVMKELQEKLKATQVPKWLEELGIDPWKDIESISLAMRGPKNDPKPEDGQRKPQEPYGFLVARGRFDGEKLMAAAEKAVRENGDKISIVQEDKLKLIKVKFSQNQFMYVTMVDDKTIVAGTTSQMMHDAVKQADNPRAKVQVRKSLAALARNLDDKAAYYQVMELERDAFKGLGENPLFEDTELLKKQLAEMTSYAVTVRVSADVAIEVAGAMTGPEAAAAFGESAKQMVEKGRTLLPLLATAAAEWTAVVNDLKKSMKVTVTGDVVKLTAKITGDSIGKGLGVNE